ncbi:energy coupling factor transporter S component ThiW [Clostridium folliculivorans]|uniref:Energy coupling factor transporter S component ThiW n=1 Tax=Clostridium folliculivorans TaxID=2886038 RepID=A0A9W6DCL3_9CLOT|nr:energy coupling factor transporter S component ThiW [Clostridium folliculivorans]GKU27121.1 energy coupling factor transporter S component ThiW [Clostridium folliculivorans]GKU31738.1 energy coupling factor transporter S component ThiW [Clostridium folliculivorans]
MKQNSTNVNNNQSMVYKLTLSGLFIAFGTVTGSVFYIPFLGGKMFPVQHFLNVVAAVVLGPFYGVANAFCISLLRNILGTGSILAFPGSMVGAFLAGIVYKKFKNIYLTAVGEFIGTGILGALIAYPMATMVLGKKVAAFAYVFPFSLSCGGGAILAVILLSVPVIRKTIKREAL